MSGAAAVAAPADLLGARAHPAATRQLVRAGDATYDVEVVRRGSGPPLLYLHGTEGLYQWPAGLVGLETSYEIVAPHLPGFGTSSGLDFLDDVRDVAIFLQDLMDALGIATAVVVGHSMGGMFAAELAAAAPHRVSRLVLVAPYGLWLDDAPVADLVGALRKDRLKLSWHNPEHPVAVDQATPLENPAAALERDLLETQHLISCGKFLWGIPDRGLAKRLHRIAAPALVVWGADDRVMDASTYGAAFIARLPRAVLQLIADAGHNVVFEQPEPFVAHVARFLGVASTAHQLPRLT